MRSSLIGLLLCCTAQAQMGGAVITSGYATQYFMDALNGSSGAACTYLAPCKTPADAGMPATLANYTAIFLRAGTCEWSRAGWNITGTPLTNFTLASYGSGSQPFLDGANILTGTDACGASGSGTWSLVAGQTTCWQIAGVVDKVSATNFIQFFINGVTNKALLTSQAAACAGTAGSWYVTSTSASTSFTLTYNSGSATNPGSDGNLYEYSARQAGFNCSTSGYCANIIISNIKSCCNLSNNGSIAVNNNGVFENITASLCTKHCALSGAGSSIYGAAFGPTWYNGNGSADYVNFTPEFTGSPNSFTNIIDTQTAFDGSINVFDQHSAIPNAGTVSTSISSPGVTGSGTSFSAYLIGQQLVVGTNTCTVASVTDGTHLACSGSFPANNTNEAYSFNTLNYGTTIINGLTATNVSMGTQSWSTISNVSINGGAGPTAEGVQTYNNFSVVGPATVCVSLPYAATITINNPTCSGSFSSAAIYATGPLSITIVGGSLTNTHASNAAIQIIDSASPPPLLSVTGTIFTNGSGGAGNAISAGGANNTPASLVLVNNTYNCVETGYYQTLGSGSTTYNLNTSAGRSAWLFASNETGATFMNCGN